MYVEGDVDGGGGISDSANQRKLRRKGNSSSSSLLLSLSLSSGYCVLDSCAYMSSQVFYYLSFHFILVFVHSLISSFHSHPSIHSFICSFIHLFIDQNFTHFKECAESAVCSYSTNSGMCLHAVDGNISAGSVEGVCVCVCIYVWLGVFCCLLAFANACLDADTRCTRRCLSLCV
jgi:hypothetical protein